MSISCQGVWAEPAKIKLCRRCGQNPVVCERDQICPSCRADSYERFLARHRKPAAERTSKPPKPHLEAVIDLGKACRAAGITLKDIARIAAERRIEETDMSHG